MRSAQTTDLTGLPTELIIMIFDNLTPQELLLVAQTCKQFEDQSSINSIWKKFLKLPDHQGQYKNQFFEFPLTRQDKYQPQASPISQASSISDEDEDEDTRYYSYPTFD